MSGTWTKRIETVAPFGFVIAAILLFVVPQAEVEAFTLNVQDPEGNPVAGFRWLLEEDNAHPVTPGAEVADSLSMSIHKSYAPVVQAVSQLWFKVGSVFLSICYNV